MATSVVTALLPVLAAGFAVQRLLEILDPVLARLIGEDKKKHYLGLLSLISGLGLALGAKLQVLAHLGVELKGADYLDYLVTGLIVSGGTEGVNSILKFLNYMKEEMKTGSMKEGLDAREALTLSSSGLMALREDPIALTLSTPEDALKEALQNQVRRFRNDLEISLDFENGKFNQHMVSDEEAQVVTLSATEEAAALSQRILNGKGKQMIRGSIGVNTKYGAAVVVMRRALAQGADPA